MNISNQREPIGTSNRFYSPLVLNIARTEGISMSEIEAIAGSGIGGRLSKNDLLSYIQNRKSGSVSFTTTKSVSITSTPAQKVHPDKEKKLFRWTIYVSELCIT